MGYSDEQETPKFDPLPVGCIFDGAMGWHNTYRIVDLAIACGMDKDPTYGWHENDKRIMDAYENGESELALDDAEMLDEAAIGDVALHWSERAMDYLTEHCLSPMTYLEWDDGLYVREYTAQEVCDAQGWSDDTMLTLALRFIADQDTNVIEAWDQFTRDVAHEHAYRLRLRWYALGTVSVGTKMSDSDEALPGLGESEVSNVEHSVAEAVLRVDDQRGGTHVTREDS